MTRGSLCILSHLESPELDAMARDMPGLRFVTIPEDGPLPEGTRGDACLTFAWGSPNMADVVATGVRWVHTIGTGVDRFPLDAVAGTPLTCSRGASAIPISEWTLAMLLAFEKQIPERWVNKPPEQWHIADLGGLHGRTLGLIGLGGIAQAVAQRALAFGMRTLAYRRRPELPSPIEGVEIVGDLTRLLESSDHVVVAASATPQTHHMINAERLAQMKPGAHLVNVARGSLLDQEALRGALDRGTLARASLDVCEPEPLPADHWLYSHPKVRLSAHVSWSMPDALPMLFGSFRTNLRHFLAGEPLEGLVDLDQGY